MEWIWNGIMIAIGFAVAPIVVGLGIVAIAIFFKIIAMIFVALSGKD